jgi:5-methylthioadenosine/S-adenosylhomocysteine deaminase
MGLDGQASGTRACPFENMRMGLYGVRAHYANAAILSPRDVLRMATLGSAHVLGLNERLGSLEPGKLADFLVLDPIDFGHVFDPYAALVFGGSSRQIERVYIGGRLVALHGEPVKNNWINLRRNVMRRVAAAAATDAGSTMTVGGIADSCSSMTESGGSDHEAMNKAQASLN